MDSEQVLQSVAQLRALLGDHPFWLFVAVLILVSLAARLARLRPPRSGGATLATPRTATPSPATLPTVALAAFAIALYAIIAFWYVRTEAYYDFAEPTVACIAWLFHRGQPIYHAFDAAERYSHMYGPLAFIIPGEFLALVGPSIMASKASGALAGLLSVAVVYRLMRSARASVRDAIVLTGLFALLCLMYRNESFWIRPDSFSLLFTSLSLLAAIGRQRWLAAIGVGLCIAALLNLKLTGPLYALPAFGLLIARFGLGPVIAATITAGVAAVVPFVAFDNVSFENYLVWVNTSARNGLVFSLFRHNLEWALFLLLPLAPTLMSRLPGRRWLYGGLLLGVAGVTIAASKPGAGPYHLLPFWPVVLYAVALDRDAVPRDTRWRAGRAAFVITTVLVACLQQIYFIAITRSTAGGEAVNDLTQFMNANPDRSIAMGYANSGERSTFVRPALVFRGGPYPIDAPAVQEFEMSGIDIPKATIDALRRCDVDLWLIPKGAKPFDGPNKYPATGFAQLFPDSFKQTFFESYEHARDTRAFEVWRCRHASRP